MDTQLEPSAFIPFEPPTRKRFSFLKWLMKRTRVTLNYDTSFWRTSLTGIWTVYSIVLIITSLGMPTGLGITFDTVMMTLIGTIGLTLAAIVVAFLLSLAYIPVPRLYVGSIVAAAGVIDYLFEHADIDFPQSIVLTALIIICGMLGGSMIALLASRRVKPKVKLSVIIAVTIVCLSFSYWPAENKASLVSTSLDAIAEESGVAALQAHNPSEPGSYDYQTFTYSSGKDRHRNVFAGKTDLVSQSVDASTYIRNWSWLRSFFWGFDQKALPVNGRVWMPVGESPFPLVLIVHGNHLMEQFSDEGYGYLGELLATRGFIAVSVDENFLNYSVWADIPAQDMKVRAWMLLKHLQQINDFSKQEGNPFSGRVDMQSIALIGHSRGGQAVAMAADSSKWFSEDKSLMGIKSFHIGAVIGIAPTDKTVDKQSATLKDTSYLTLQGASDGDVDTFNGERQYIRTSITSGSQSFKTSLYIGEANHSRFNTSWGAMDDSLPGGLLLKRSDMIEAADQREIAKVYVSAFLETVLHGSKDYQALFRDYRTGLAWLPEATYINRYEDGGFQELIRFDDDFNKMTYKNGITVKAVDLEWSEESAEDRDGNGKGTRGAALQWKQKGGTYTIEIPKNFRDQLQFGKGAALAFSMTNLERDLLSPAPVKDTKLSDTKSGTAAEAEIPAPSIMIELQSSSGATVRLPLNSFMKAVELPHTTFTIFPWLEKEIKDGKYKESSEPVFQTYQLSLERFHEANEQFDPSQLARITFRFSNGPGKIMLDDIGIEADTP
ncbi:hypothetical protein Back11_04240 [Paenibacillus baekrokdamisoli]|uniref:Alpha/beta hydrolase n=1 Tax=Paenibacillus baekrokdamisoli TaxID=1712516 RepID=A0A3G9J7V1_9BACL|nr:alpha/beta hydrolase [Paenibacillus baekrokdamisoli]MBB3067738.1 hypothetical protein [Paenibacillus baekrokdamisoli]BBH19079.1 hypothetical protein Back11_04240 [Paenibacillus baekrokdamisoli]